MSRISFEAEPGSRSALHEIRLPRVPLLMGVALVVLVFVLAATARLTGKGAVRLDLGAPIASRALELVVEPSGDVLVLDGASREPRLRVPAGESGFLRGLDRVLARRRMIAGTGAGGPVVISRYRDGQLGVRDPASGFETLVTSFGPTQVATIAALLEAPGGAETTAGAR